MRKALLELENTAFSLRQQCRLLDINRSSLYYQPLGESEENLLLMRLLDEQYTETPYYGVLRMQAYLYSATIILSGRRQLRWPVELVDSGVFL